MGYFADLCGFEVDLGRGGNGSCHTFGGLGVPKTGGPLDGGEVCSGKPQEVAIGVGIGELVFIDVFPFGMGFGDACLGCRFLHINNFIICSIQIYIICATRLFCLYYND